MAELFPTVDADGHLEENHIDWKARLPEKYRSHPILTKPFARDDLERVLNTLKA